jgi:glycosyltransferase involved in cell wall biosynthesis
MSVDFAVIVCAHDEARWNDLQAAIESLDAQTLRPAETVVIVDHNPRLLEMARKRFSDATVVENAGQPGLGEARNTGIESSSSPVVAFLDDDAVASAEWLSRLAEPYAEPDVAGCHRGARLLSTRLRLRRDRALYTAWPEVAVAAPYVRAGGERLP